MQKAEKLLDKEVQEVKEIHLHTTKMPHDSYDESDFESLAAQAIQTQMRIQNDEMTNAWKARQDTMESAWNDQRKAMETHYKAALDEHASNPVSIIAHKTASAQLELVKNTEHATKLLTNIQ
jgi:hypothetical protein